MPVTPTPEEILTSHRWHAIECNNLAWSLSELGVRTPVQDAEMLNAAHASVFHWSKVGNELNAARGQMLLGRVHAELGHGSLALAYAEASYSYVVSHDPADWELAFAHAILAHAALAAGKQELHRNHYTKAEQLGQAIADPDEREIFLRTFRGVAAASTNTASSR